MLGAIIGDAVVSNVEVGQAAIRLVHAWRQHPKRAKQSFKNDGKCT
jgi:hypothetical protein